MIPLDQEVSADETRLRSPEEGSRSALCAGLVTKRKLSAQRDCCTTSCQLLCPVGLVFLALLILSLASSVGKPGPQLELTPGDVFVDPAAYPGA